MTTKKTAAERHEIDIRTKPTIKPMTLAEVSKRWPQTKENMESVRTRKPKR